MQISHLGHSAVLVQTAGARILIDPGNVDAAWGGVTDLDAIFVTHVHPDHLDPAGVPALVAANPGVAVYVEPSIAEAGVEGIETLTALAPGASVTIGDLTVAGVGGTHAEIHRDIPLIGNVGLMITGSGEPTLFHPGDEIDTAPSGVDVLAMPLYAPWAAMKETIDFVREVGAAAGFPIHDGLIKDNGRSMIIGRVNDMTATTLTDLRGGTPVTF